MIAHTIMMACTIVSYFAICFKDVFIISFSLAPIPQIQNRISRIFRQVKKVKAIKNLKANEE